MKELEFEEALLPKRLRLPKKFQFETKDTLLPLRKEAFLSVHINSVHALIHVTEVDREVYKMYQIGSCYLCVKLRI